MDKVGSGPRIGPQTAASSRPVSPDRRQGRGREASGDDQAAGTSDRGAGPLVGQSLNRDLQEIAIEAQPREAGEAASIEDGGGGAAIMGDEFQAPGHVDADLPAEDGSVQGGGEGSVQGQEDQVGHQLQQQAIRRQAMQRLQHAGLDEQQAAAMLDEQTRTMHADAMKTANSQGAWAYTTSFGIWGLASRGAAQLAANLTTNPGWRYLANTVPTLTMPLTHDGAGKSSAPGRDKTQFVEKATVLGRNGAAQAEQERQPLAPNAGGNAFAPFRTWLSVGNIGVNAAVELPDGVAHAMIDGTSPPPSSSSADSMAGEISAERNVLNTVKNVLLFGPGVMAARHTARNLFGARAAAGWSLQEPIKMDDGKTVGSIVTHQMPSERPEHLRADGKWQELGGLEIDVEGTTHRASIIRSPDGRHVDVVLAGSQPVERAEGPVASARKAASGVWNYGKQTLGTFNWQTGTKVTSLASTVAASALLTPIIKSGAKAVLETRVPPSVAEPLSELAGSVAPNLLLGYDFIPKFMAFGNSSAPGQADGRLRNDLGQLAWSAIPLAGGRVAQATGRANPEAPVELAPQALEDLAARKADMLAGLRSGGGDAAAAMVTANGGRLQLNAQATQTFFREQAEAAQAHEDV